MTRHRKVKKRNPSQRGTKKVVQKRTASRHEIHFYEEGITAARIERKSGRWRNRVVTLCRRKKKGQPRPGKIRGGRREQPAEPKNKNHLSQKG